MATFEHGVPKGSGWDDVKLKLRGMRKKVIDDTVGSEANKIALHVVYELLMKFKLTSIEQLGVLELNDAEEGKKSKILGMTECHPTGRVDVCRICESDESRVCRVPEANPGGIERIECIERIPGSSGCGRPHTWATH